MANQDAQPAQSNKSDEQKRIIHFDEPMDRRKNNQKSTLQFFGGAGTVTGSKYLIRANGSQILLDAGLFQGLKELRLRNWRPVPFDPSKVDAVVLSHAHIDHSGYLPLLVRNHFRGKIFCTSGTADLLGVMLPDSAHLQEEEAAMANKHGYSKHKPHITSVYN